MQKLVWQNANGVELDLTSGNYGITEWEGFSNTSLNIQQQQVPFQDGGVFLDALIEQRELSVTLAIQDNNNLELRYQQRRELISALNPKLGEGYLIYTNDYTSKRIKCVAQIPLFETHNSDTVGTPKASLSWTACEPYWEDLVQKSVSILSGGTLKVQNDGDVEINPTDIYVWGEGSNVSVKNITNGTQLKINGTVKDIDVTLEMGRKDVRKARQYVNHIAGGKVAETDFYQYILTSGDVLKTADFKTFENVVSLSDSMDITTDGINIYVCGSSYIGLIKENGDYVERTDINADSIYYSKKQQKLYYYNTTSDGIYSLDSFDSTPVLVKGDINNNILCFSDIGDDVFACGTQGYLINITQDSVIPTEAGNKNLRFIAPYRNGYAVVGTGGFAQYNENGTWSDIPLNITVILNGFCYNNYTDSYYFGGYNGFLVEIRSDNTKVNINLNTDGAVSYIFFSKLFETVQFVCNGIIQIKNETEVVRITQNDTNFTCCKFVDFLGKYVAGGQDSIFTSSDFNTWERVFYQSGVGVFSHIESDDTHIVLGIEDSKVMFESSDGVTFIEKPIVVEKLWVTYNTEAEKFFFIGNFGNNEYWICSVNDLLSNDITKIYQINTTTWTTTKTNSASNGETTIFILSQTSEANPILYYTTDAGDTWTEKTSVCTSLNKMFMNNFLATRIVDQKLLITINKLDNPSLPYFVMWDSQQEDFITPSFVTDEDYIGFEANYTIDSPYLGGYIDNGGDDSIRCVVLLSAEGTTVTITKVLENSSDVVQFYLSAVMVGNQLVYSYFGENGSTYAFYNGELHEGSIITKIKGYIAILEPISEDVHWIICDNNFNEITTIPFDYLFLNIPNNNEIVSDGENNYGIINSNWEIIRVSHGTGNIVCLFNFNDNIYIADAHNIYTENYNPIWSYEGSNINDCKISDDKLFINQTNGIIKVVDKNFNNLQSVYTSVFEKIYPMRNGDIIGFAKSGDIKSIYKYDHILQTTKKIYELNDQITTFYNLGYFDTLNEVLIITNRGFIGIIDNYITELLNSRYTTYAFVKNKQPYFVGLLGFRGTIDFAKSHSIINQVKELTLKLDVGENNLVFGYEGNYTMMMNLIYSPKYNGV